MKKIVLVLLLSLGLTYAGDKTFISAGVLASTTPTALTTYGYSGTVSFASLRVDTDLVNIAAYNVYDILNIAGFGFYVGTGVGTAFNALDTWTFKLPIGLTYDILMFDVLVEYVPSFALYTAGALGNFGYVDAINIGLRVNF